MEKEALVAVSLVRTKGLMVSAQDEDGIAFMHGTQCPQLPASSSYDLSVSIRAPMRRTVVACSSDYATLEHAYIWVV